MAFGKGKKIMVNGEEVLYDVGSFIKVASLLTLVPNAYRSVKKGKTHLSMLVFCSLQALELILKLPYIWEKKKARTYMICFATFFVLMTAAYTYPFFLPPHKKDKKDKRDLD